MHIDEELFNTPEFKKNLQLYQQAVKSGETVFIDVDDLTDIIDYYNYDGQVDDANRVADYALSMYPGAIGPLVFKARQALMAGDIKLAKQYCDNIDDKVDIDYIYLQAEIYIAQEKYDAADFMLVDMYDTVEQDDIDNYPLDVAALFLDYNVLEYAEKWLAKVDNQNNPECMEMKARIYSSKGNTEKAKKILERLIDINPFICRYWNMLSIIQLFNNEYADCLSSAEYSLAIKPNNSDGLWCKAKALIALDEPQKALDCLMKFLEKKPHTARVEAEIGSCYMQMSKLELAIDALERAEDDCIDDDVMLQQICDDLAFCYGTTGRLTEALGYLNKSERIMASTKCDDETYEELTLQRMVIRGHVLLLNGKIDQAMSLFNDAIDKSKSNPAIIYKVMASVYDYEMYEQCIDYYNLMETVAPDDWIFGAGYMAASLVRVGRGKEAIPYLMKVCKINPQEAEMLFGHVFPEGVTPDQYYDFLCKNSK